jgi:hypothetical protein
MWPPRSPDLRPLGLFFLGGGDMLNSVSIAYRIDTKTRVNPKLPFCYLVFYLLCNFKPSHDPSQRRHYPPAEEHC